MKHRTARMGILALTVILLLSSCGGTKNPPTETAIAQTSASDTVSVTETEAESETETEPVTEAVTEIETEAVTEPVTEAKTEAVTEAKKPTKVEEKTEPDILGLATMKVGAKDYAGYTVTKIDREEGLYIAQIEDQLIDFSYKTYRGYVMVIDDPSRLFLGTIPTGTRYGQNIFTIMSNYENVIAGVNASGFADPKESGSGADLVGYQMSCGVARGTFLSEYTSMFMTKDNKLVVGNISDWEKYGARDGMQFGPILIENGKEAYETVGNFTYGYHPRTAVGQRADGAIVLLVIDGRVDDWSCGCSMDDLRAIMKKYKVEIAGCCDGGSSCVMTYGDTLVNKNSSASPTTGRLIPNAFLVKSKKKS